MDNGRGGHQAETRFGCTSVLSTRHILKEFARVGSFPEPHCFEEPDALAGAIDDLSFAAPSLTAPPSRILRNFLADVLRGRQINLSRNLSYIPDSERIAILRSRD